MDEACKVSLFFDFNKKIGLRRKSLWIIPISNFVTLRSVVLNLTILRFQQRVAEYSLIQRRDAASLGNRIPTFRRNVQPSSSRVNTTYINILGQLPLEDEGSTFIRNVGIRIPSDAASRPKRMNTVLEILKLTSRQTQSHGEANNRIISTFRYECAKTFQVSSSVPYSRECS
jgi:hypothetical protein